MIHVDNNIIEPSTSQWSSPIVLVAKKTKDKDGNKQYRFAIDYRKLNKVTVPTSFPIPRIEDVFDSRRLKSFHFYCIRPHEWIFTDSFRPTNKTQNCICYSPRCLPIQRLKFWAHECANGLSNA